MGATNNPPAADTESRELILTRLIDAPREKVFRCWTEPGLITQWFHAATVEDPRTPKPICAPADRASS
jgi:uncharacterized protein YndB with AHSA1/START domain